MTEQIVQDVAYGALWVGLILISWACYSLRDFSRSQLEEICRRRGHERRFGEILHGYETTLLTLEILKAACWFLVVSLIFGRWRQDWLPLAHGSLAYWWEVVSDLVVFLLVLVMAGVIAPWVLSRLAGEGFLETLWPVLRGATGLLKPVVWMAKWFDRMSHRVVGVKEPEVGAAAVISDEIRTVVEQGQRDGILENEAHSMIHRVMDLPDVDVADIMTPRTAMDTISEEATLEQAREMFVNVGHSRIPIVGDGRDDIVGILYAKDLLEHLTQDRSAPPQPLVSYARKPYYVPETMGIHKLLEAFKRERVHVAVVLDEYGGVAGLVTMEDILEEIVGEIADEHDEGELESVRQISPNVYDVDAGLHIDDVNQRLNLEIPNDGEVDTLGGFVFSLLGRVPIEGEQAQWNDLCFTVQHADKRRIRRLRIDLPAEPSAPTQIPQNESKPKGE